MLYILHCNIVHTYFNIKLAQVISFADEMYRVFLKTTGRPGSDYINGSFINVGADIFMHYSLIKNG